MGFTVPRQRHALTERQGQRGVATERRKRRRMRGITLLRCAAWFDFRCLFSAMLLDRRVAILAPSRIHEELAPPCQDLRKDSGRIKDVSRAHALCLSRPILALRNPPSPAELRSPWLKGSQDEKLQAGGLALLKATPKPSQMTQEVAEVAEKSLPSALSAAFCSNVVVMCRSGCSRTPRPATRRDWLAKGTQRSGAMPGSLRRLVRLSVPAFGDTPRYAGCHP